MYLYIYISISIATGYLYLHPYVLYIYRILPGTSISLIYCALTTKTNRIARILAVKKMITYKPRLVYYMTYISTDIQIYLQISKYFFIFLNVSTDTYLDIFQSINENCRFMTSTAQLMIAALLFCVEIVAVASSILQGKYFIAQKIFTPTIVLVTCRRCRCCSTLATRGCSWCATRTGAA